MADSSPEMRQFYRDFFRLGLRVTGEAHQRGVTVLVGTDAPDTQVFPGYDKIVYRRPKLGRMLRLVTYTMEATPLRAIGLSHLLTTSMNSQVY